MKWWPNVEIDREKVDVILNKIFATLKNGGVQRIVMAFAQLADIAKLPN